MRAAARRRWRLALAAALLCTACAGCDGSGGGSPFRSLGKRGDSGAARPADR